MSERLQTRKANLKFRNALTGEYRECKLKEPRGREQDVFQQAALLLKAMMTGKGKSDLGRVLRQHSHQKEIQGAEERERGQRKVDFNSGRGIV